MIEDTTVKLGVSDTDQYLVCPCCGGKNLHQIKARMIFKDEDMDGVEHTVSKKLGGEVQSRPMKAKMIAGRRDVMYIDFSCETCSEADLYTLKIQQYMGKTIISWW